MIIYIYLLVFFVLWTGVIIVEHILKKRGKDFANNKSSPERSRPGKKSIL